MDIAKAIAYLHPNAQPLIDYIIEQTAGTDLAGNQIASEPVITYWSPALGPQPTPEQLAAAEAAYDAAQAQAQQEATTLRNTVISTAQSAVGVTFPNLTAAQRNALMVVLFWKAGALDKDGKIRPLAEWAK